MLELECPNLLEHDQNRAIAYGHTWSPVYELTPKPVPLHHGHAISIDMAFSATWAANEGWISEARRDGDLYAAIPDGEVGKCRFIYLSDFASRADMDASLERALQVHKNLMAMEGGGVGKEPFIT